MNYNFRNRRQAQYLYKFLRKHNLFEKWFGNVKKQHPERFQQYNENHDILELLDMCRNIDYSFCWASTPQGHMFWEKMQRKFVSEFNDIATDIRIMKTIKC